MWEWRNSSAVKSAADLATDEIPFPRTQLRGLQRPVILPLIESTPKSDLYGNPQTHRTNWHRPTHIHTHKNYIFKNVFITPTQTGYVERATESKITEANIILYYILLNVLELSKTESGNGAIGKITQSIWPEGCGLRMLSHLFILGQYPQTFLSTHGTL